MTTERWHQWSDTEKGWQWQGKQFDYLTTYIGYIRKLWDVNNLNLDFFKYFYLYIYIYIYICLT